MSRFPTHHITPGITRIANGVVTHTPLKNWDETDTTMPKLIEALGGQAAFEALPILDLETCTNRGGGTGYIDFVRASDMSAPVMRGEDEVGRPFVAFRIKSEKSLRPDKPFAEVLFRRYTTGPDWVSGGGHTLCPRTVDDDVLSTVRHLARYGCSIEDLDNWTDGDGDPDKPRHSTRAVRLVL